MQDEIWHQRSIQNYNGAVLSVYSVDRVLLHIWESAIPNKIIAFIFYVNVS